jgi:circadian clock protein KaiB
VGGELDAATSPAVEELIRRLIDDGRTHLLVDLTEATFLDSTALSSLLACSRRLRRPNCGMAIVVGDHAQPRARFDLTGTREVLNVCGSREEALALVEEPRETIDTQRPPPEGQVQLRLYVNAGTPNTARAIAALQELRRRYLRDADVEVIDLNERPDVAERERLLAVPALVRVAPPPVRRIIGDLTEHQQVLWALDLGATAEGST